LVVKYHIREMAGIIRRGPICGAFTRNDGPKGSYSRDLTVGPLHNLQVHHLSKFSLHDKSKIVMAPKAPKTGTITSSQA
jgi:hypothetical protein